MLRWGLMGGGFISSRFAAGLEVTEDMTVHAVASVSGNNPFGIRAKKSYRTYEELTADPEIDAVYVGTLHPQHLPCVRLCLETGKPVLCEKPVTVNSRELQEILSLAKEKQTFFMEAMWSRYLPAVRYLREILLEKTFGRTDFVQITFGSRADQSARRLFDVNLGGGALLDIGVYGINLASFWLGELPKEIHSHAECTEETVDLYTSVQLTYPGGAAADLTFSINRNLTDAACIVTENAEFTVPYFWRPDTILRNGLKGGFRVDRLQLRKEFPMVGNGYHYEALEVKRCLEEGLLESPDMTWQESMAVMKIMDTVRQQCGIRYPQDQYRSV